MTSPLEPSTDDTIVIDDHGRPEPPLRAGEAATLVGFLDFQRATFAWRTSGLDADALGRPLVSHPSDMTLAGLMKHLAYVEDHWFHTIAGARPTAEPWASVDWAADEDWDWHSAPDDSPEELHALWEASVARSRAVTSAILGDPAGLNSVHEAWGGQDSVSFRWILIHMIEEYARHNGHADLLREPIDGQVGE